MRIFNNGVKTNKLAVFLSISGYFNCIKKL